MKVLSLLRAASGNPGSRILLFQFCDLQIPVPLCMHSKRPPRQRVLGRLDFFL